MNIDIISLFPEMFTALDTGIVGRASRRKLINITHTNPRDFTENVHKSVDDRPYGGGPGMVMLYEPLKKALLQSQKSQSTPGPVIYLSPQGKPLKQKHCQLLAQEPHITLIAGRYEGIDERFIEHYVDVEYSIGDYVLSGGELPAMVMIDAITRLLPHALGHEESATKDSFSNNLLDHPHYTRPAEIDGLTVPEILQSGDHKAIARYRMQQSLGKTWQKRPDLLKRHTLNELEEVLLDEYIKHYNDQAEESRHE
jgi:tRNA (guanine37-N1)-methyltransferase